MKQSKKKKRFKERKEGKKGRMGKNSPPRPTNITMPFVYRKILKPQLSLQRCTRTYTTRTSSNNQN